ncbi:MAG: hypothetical protein QOG62_370 [Thermoleophilaceae bacterium]|jgi:hypothetical protein|nr:hypothetical protein [Thermoleophilaceae bacterium]
MRFTEFLRNAVLLFAGAASTLALCTLIAAFSEDDRRLLLLAIGWWILAGVIGLWLGRRPQTTQGIGRMLADAKAVTSMPPIEPGPIMWNRLWPLAVFTAVAGGLAFLFPPVAAVATGYALAISLAWRRQALAVQAIEERDGIQFHVEKASPFGATRLTRLPGMKRYDV